MKNSHILMTQSGLIDKVKKSRVPARLDLIQSLTGLILGLVMWGHMLFVSSILLGKDAMWTITKMFEGYFLFGKGYPIIVSFVVAGVFVIFILHALLALRKFPTSYEQYRIYRAHAKAMHHEDTTLWMWQIFTGFALFFLASAHLYQMLFWPDKIGPVEGGIRMWRDGLWPYYMIMLLAVELHGGIGLYRLVVKWGWPNIPRSKLKKIKWGITFFFLILGIASLFAYMKIGYDYRNDPNPTYTPEWIKNKEDVS